MTFFYDKRIAWHFTHVSIFSNNIRSAYSKKKKKCIFCFFFRGKINVYSNLAKIAKSSIQNLYVILSHHTSSTSKSLSPSSASVFALFFWIFLRHWKYIYWLWLRLLILDKVWMLESVTNNIKYSSKAPKKERNLFLSLVQVYIYNMMCKKCKEAIHSEYYAPSLLLVSDANKTATAISWMNYCNP